MLYARQQPCHQQLCSNFECLEDIIEDYRNGTVLGHGHCEANSQWSEIAKFSSPPTVAYKLLHWHVAVILKTFKLSYINNCFVQF